MVFNIVDKMNMLKSESYLEFLDIIQNDESLVFKNGVLNNIVVPPVLLDTNESIKSLRSQKTNLMREYYDIYTRIVASNKPDSLKRDLDDVIDKINNIEKDIESMYLYDEKVNENKGALENNIKDLQNQLATTIDHKNAYLIYKKLMKLYETEPEKDINFYIDKLPNFDISKKKKVIIEREEEPKQKVEKTKGKVSPVEHLIIKDNVKKLIETAFKFKTTEECKSSKRTQPFYTSKEDLIKVIDINPKLKAHMPNKYKTMTKEKICDHLFF